MAFANSQWSIDLKITAKHSFLIIVKSVCVYVCVLVCVYVIQEHEIGTHFCI